MHFAIYSSPLAVLSLEKIVDFLTLIEKKHTFSLSFSLATALEKFTNASYSTFVFSTEKSLEADFLISLGGDGTILEAVQYALPAQIPILGINLGRLGFLTSSYENFEVILDRLEKKQYTIQKRGLLSMTPTFFGAWQALNEISIQKTANASMIHIKVFANGHFLNEYWADGLIVSTPTGSTAYSLSCGGPIISPDTEALCLSPIAPHNLSVRPMVIAWDSVLEIEVDGRLEHYLISMDHQSQTVEKSQKIRIEPAQKQVQLLVLEGDDFFHTLRKKLYWGIDRRKNEK